MAEAAASEECWIGEVDREVGKTTATMMRTLL